MRCSRRRSVLRSRALPAIVRRIRRVFDLGADVGIINAQLRADPILAGLVRVRPGLRVPGAWDGFELAIRAILGQQITVAGARRGRLVEAYGEPLRGGDGDTSGLNAVFPRAERVASVDLSGLGMPRARAAAISGLAAATVADPELFHRDESLAAAITRLTTLPGVGEWTAQYIAMRALREPDAFPAADVGLLRALTGPRGASVTGGRHRTRGSVAAVACLRGAAPVDIARGRRARPPSRRRGGSGLMNGDPAGTFRRLHDPAKPLLLPNAWDAGSARLIESCGAAAIATTSAGLAWARGYPDGDVLPAAVLATAIAEIARVVSVPLSADIEGGYSADPGTVGETVAAVLDARAVGINIEDGTSPPDLLERKIEAARKAASRAGIDLFINARADVYLHQLVPPERAVDESIERARRYRAAGCDGVFVPGLTDSDEIRTIAAAIDAPLNLLVRRNLPPVAELGRLGVARVSAGSGIAQAAYGLVRRATKQLLDDGRYEAMFESDVDYGQINALFSPPPE